jgi:hypothetical protein
MRHDELYVADLAEPGQEKRPDDNAAYLPADILSEEALTGAGWRGPIIR